MYSYWDKARMTDQQRSIKSANMTLRFMNIFPYFIKRTTNPKPYLPLPLPLPLPPPSTALLNGACIRFTAFKPPIHV